VNGEVRKKEAGIFANRDCRLRDSIYQRKEKDIGIKEF